MEEVGGLAPSPDGESATLTEVLDHGGWLLIDPRPVAAEHPDTFELPSGDDLGALGPGSGIKAMLRCADLADPVRDGLAAYGPDGRPQLALVTERMWLLVLGRDGDRLDCVLDNAPYAAYTRLVPGARISVPKGSVRTTSPRTWRSRSRSGCRCSRRKRSPARRTPPAGRRSATTSRRSVDARASGPNPRGCSAR